MREVNFSIPNVNKASVSITTALYDRRALDCTSTLPLINSLNHLAYLTTSSARIRDILTVDGGVERLVCILKAGRSKDLMSMWKWNLAFQCVVNIGVRGSENVRTRVVEADMVPVIATILDNYVQVIDKLQSKAEAASAKKTRSFRRQAPPPSIEIPAPISQHRVETRGEPITNNSRHTLAVPGPSERVAYVRQTHNHGRTHDTRHHFHTYHSGTQARDQGGLQPLAAALPAMDMGVGAFGLRPVRDVDRLPSMLQAGGPSQPESPTTPNPPPPASSNRASRRSSRPSIRHQRSISGESDDAGSDENSVPSGGMDSGNEPIVGIQTGEDGREPIIDSVDTPMAITGAHGTDGQDAETFNITHRSPIDGSIISPTANASPAIGFSPNPPTVNPPLAIPSSFQVPTRYLTDNSSIVLPSMPQPEDVLMSLQLLAYVSKYCNLRSYFQKSHLVPKLSISREIHLLDDDPNNFGAKSQPIPLTEEEEEEYLLPDDYNIFPLVEKFTVRHHPPDMQYWAGVVMRNLCRKDDSRGGIRQCAYYECGKWEEFTRQFAKCRRCRRTKYCSKECQKSAWVYHRHWCVAAQQ
ncbi:hypothetical protein L873DRAFT_1708513 [Choiromyces venosus 120613-1]|uniref:MYND-type zinc finger protein samB n=1 Tax=Choiromyces venosus 120613-1 TaxID=1336337 RepID=A0A3N4J6T2_9PEZI|nr:hypothetical protein L873DRAFT_1708513 [Choiromyces venosus 120613-1]